MSKSSFDEKAVSGILTPMEPEYLSRRQVIGRLGGSLTAGAVGSVISVTQVAQGAPALPSPHAGSFNILDFGAVGDGQTVNTEAIRKAINAATNAGGGTVLVPNGTFVTGTIHLRGH